MSASLVGSEMCIRDSFQEVSGDGWREGSGRAQRQERERQSGYGPQYGRSCGSGGWGQRSQRGQWPSQRQPDSRGWC
eukprot:11579345-Alexandrium_andersonii.AAC.1